MSNGVYPRTLDLDLGHIACGKFPRCHACPYRDNQRRRINKRSRVGPASIGRARVALAFARRSVIVIRSSRFTEAKYDTLFTTEECQHTYRQSSPLPSRASTPNFSVGDRGPSERHRERTPLAAIFAGRLGSSHDSHARIYADFGLLQLPVLLSLDTVLQLHFPHCSFLSLSLFFST